MRWLLIVLLVSLAALLFAAAGVARHILVRRARIRSKPDVGASRDSEPAAETDVETDI
jgi:hypothetical protein